MPEDMMVERKNLEDKLMLWRRLAILSVLIAVMLGLTTAYQTKREFEWRMTAGMIAPHLSLEERLREVTPAMLEGYLQRECWTHIVFTEP